MNKNGLTMLQKISLKPDWEWVPPTGVSHKLYLLIILKYKIKDIIQENCLKKDQNSVILDIEILGWFPVGPVLPHGGEGVSLILFGDPSSDGVKIKMPYGVDVLHWLASHTIFSYWVG